MRQTDDDARVKIMDRQSGRTSNLMKRAIARTEETGEVIFYVIGDFASVSYFRSLWEHLGGDSKMIKFIRSTDDTRGVNKNRVFVDHYVYEKAYTLARYPSL